MTLGITKQGQRFLISGRLEVELALLLRAKRSNFEILLPYVHLEIV